MSRWRRPAAILVAAAVGCVSPVDGGSGDQGVVDPFLSRPFAGTFTVTSVFDHDLPLSWDDGNGVVISWWGATVSELNGHQGYDWPMPEGTPLLAAAPGVVTRAGRAPEDYCPPLGRSTRNIRVVLLHTTPGGASYYIAYAHLSSTDVRVDDVVDRGQVVGFSGDTGCSTGPHLHFQVERLVPTLGPTVPGALGVFANRSVVVDPYGWAGSGADPWAQAPWGSDSQWLWLAGEAPEVGPVPY